MAHVNSNQLMMATFSLSLSKLNKYLDGGPPGNSWCRRLFPVCVGTKLVLIEKRSLQLSSFIAKRTTAFVTANSWILSLPMKSYWCFQWLGFVNRQQNLRIAPPSSSVWTWTHECTHTHISPLNDTMLELSTLRYCRRHLTTNQGIPGSSPGRVESLVLWQQVGVLMIPTICWPNINVNHKLWCSLPLGTATGRFFQSPFAKVTMYLNHVFNEKAKIKCSICSYQFNIWYVGHVLTHILIWFLVAGQGTEVYLTLTTGCIGLALQSRAAH